LAGMLPPFVPPSARVATEILPSITEFVVDRVEHSFDSSFGMGGVEAGGVATLPSIDEFVRHDRTPGVGAETVEDEFVQRTSRSPWGTYEAQHAVSGAPAAPTPSTPAASLEPDLVPVERRTPPSGSEDAIVNEIAEPAEAWAASAAGGSAVAGAIQESAPAPETAQPATPTPIASEVWVAEERDAFDWHGVANLAVPPAEEQRAAEEWSSTEWERSSGSVQDHIASLVAQVARRVRSGELEVQGSKQMGPEAALVAVLSALLAEPGRK
jgi:hypothetical protein